MDKYNNDRESNLILLINVITTEIETKAAELETRNRELEEEACAEREVRSTVVRTCVNEVN